MAQTYDPGKLVAAVTRILSEAGVEPDMGQDGYGYVTAFAGAGMLLRGLGVCPAMDPADAYRQTLTSGSWEDTDNRRAEQFGPPPGE